VSVAVTFEILLYFAKYASHRVSSYEKTEEEITYKIIREREIKREEEGEKGSERAKEREREKERKKERKRERKKEREKE
jgi:centrosomal protein CEP76